MIALWLTLMSGPAHAAEPGWYHPNAIAGASVLYQRASKGAGATFQQRAAQAEALGAALDEYRTALDLLGDRATPADRERLAALQKRFYRERAVLEAFASAMLEDFDAQFSAAMDRAAPAGARTCEPTIRVGPKLPGLPTRSEKNPACVGPDRSAEVARTMDADPKLKQAIDEILALSWPSVTVEVSPVPPTPSGGRHVPVSALASPLSKPLAAIRRQDEEARAPFEAAIEEGATKEQLAALLGKAREVDVATAAARAALAAPALVAADKVFAKWAKKEGPTGWCPQPALLGGCEGSAASAAEVAALLANKKVAAALSR